MLHVITALAKVPVAREQPQHVAVELVVERATDAHDARLRPHALAAAHRLLALEEILE